MADLTPEQRALAICVIAKGVGNGLPRNHTERCGECERIAQTIHAAVRAENEACAKLVEPWIPPYDGGTDELADLIRVRVSRP